MSAPIHVLFVCMGNICRSPAAEAVFLDKISQAGVAGRFEVDSAGTGGWHAGEPADPRSAAEGERRGYRLDRPARQLTRQDGEHFDWLICMDENNRREMLRSGIPAAKIRLLTDWHPDPQVRAVDDPYYGGADGFVTMYDRIEVACERLIADLLTA
ncbi:low molecular weight protein-tyrosine-phosphatase [Granulosicoccaceae sp. 1_MG-2023]|nr:low molecular weight protein-tyrosine-phosphatase [Granulosicoccaceae sp. 1_MG-2023]